MIPRQTKVTCSPLGNFTHFPLVRKTTTKDDAPLLGSIVFFVRWPKTGRRCLFCFPCSCSCASAATRRTVRSEEGKLRQEERSFGTEQNTFSVRRTSRTPQAGSKSHRPWRFCTPSRASARPRVQCFLFLPSLLHLSCNFFVFSWLRTKKTVKVR